MALLMKKDKRGAHVDRSGATVVDPAELLSDAKVQSDLKEVGALYERLRNSDCPPSAVNPPSAVKAPENQETPEKQETG